MKKVTNDMIMAGFSELMKAAEGLSSYETAAFAFAAYLPDVYEAMRRLEPSDDSEESAP